MVVPVLLWVVAVQVCGLAALPLALRLFRTLPDGGYGLSKPLGLLLVAYSVWLLAMLQYLEYRAATVLLVLLAVGAVCWWRWGTEAIWWLKRRTGVVAVEE